MNESDHKSGREALEVRSRALFLDSVEAVDMRTRSRLNTARQAALEAVVAAQRRPWFLRLPTWTPAAGVAAAALLGVALWVGAPGGHPGANVPAGLEDLDIVTASDGNSGDGLEMLQDDFDFYDFADKATSSEPSA